MPRQVRINGKRITKVILLACLTSHATFWSLYRCHAQEVLISAIPPAPANDISDINDPDVLIDRLAKANLNHLWLMTGSSIVQIPKQPPQSNWVKLWEKTFAQEDQLEPEVKRLIELGDKAISQVNQRMKTLEFKDALAERLALVMYSTGNAESISALVEFLATSEKLPDNLAFDMGAMPLFAATTALWRLTGRKHIFTSKQWSDWWISVKKDFVLPSDRQRPEFVESITANRVHELVTKLAEYDVSARERLVILGTNALPYLLVKELSAELLKSTRDQESDMRKTTQLARQLAWVIDELGATDKLPGFLRYEYFNERLAKFNSQSPIDEDAACRAISNCPFAEICKICLDQTRTDAKLPPEERRLSWMNFRAWLGMNRIVLSRRFDSKPQFITGDPKDFPYWHQIVPSGSPTAEIANAAPVIIKALDDPDKEVRTAAAHLADLIGFCSNERPEALMTSLRDHWFAESDSNARSSMGTALTRFVSWNVPNPFVQEVISKGLLSDRPELVADAASHVDSVGLVLNEQTRPVFDKLVELTRDEDRKLRRRAVRSLRSMSATMLEPELERLSSDADDDIRKECTFAIRSNPDPKYADILFKLAADKNQQVRTDALQSIGYLNHPESMKRLIPFLKDQQVYGFAISALAQMGGKDALPLMMEELEAGNDVSGMMYQHLRRITGEKLADQPEPWLEWWKMNKSEAGNDEKKD